MPSRASTAPAGSRGACGTRCRTSSTLSTASACWRWPPFTTADAMPLVANDLGKDYPTRSGPLPVFSGVSLTLDRGNALAVTGPSGSGKSTLLHILGTLDAPTVGTVTLDGVNPFSLGDKDLAAFRN